MAFSSKKKKFTNIYLIISISIVIITLLLFIKTLNSYNDINNVTITNNENNNNDEERKSDDTTITLPVATTDDDYGFFNEDVTINVTDPNLDVITLNGEVINNGYIVSEEGEYTLIARDLANNVSTVTFEIDLTKPILSIAGDNLNGIYKGDVIVTASDKNYSEMVLLGGEYVNETTITLNDVTTSISGEYIFTAKDKAGNVTSTSFEIDNTFPKISGAVDGEKYTNDVRVNASDKHFDYILVNGETFMNNSLISDDGDYTVVAVDLVGNTTTISFGIDKAAPIINGVVNGGKYNEDVTISITDLNFSNATISSTSIGTVNLTNAEEYIVTEDGKYTISAVDTYGNSISINFTMNQTPLTILNVENGKIYGEDIIVNITDENWESTTLNGNNIDKYYIISEEGRKHTLVITDTFGNKTIITDFEIDKTEPTIFKVIEDTEENVENTLYGESFTLKVRDRNLSTIEIERSYKNELGQTIIEKLTVTDDYLINKTGKYKVIATDIVDNTKIINFEVDLTPPTIKNVEDIYYANEVAVDVVDDNLDKIIIDGIIISGDGVEMVSGLEVDNGYLLAIEGNYTINAIDKAGNVTTTTISIDKTAPIFNDIINGGYYNSEFTLNVTEPNLDTIIVNYAESSSEISNGESLSLDGIYEIIATDKLGHISKITFTIDTILPEIINIEDYKHYNKDILVKVVELNLSTITVNGVEIENNMYIPLDGTYTLIATDFANNGTIKMFVIDKTNPILQAKDKSGKVIKNNGKATSEVTVTASDLHFSKITYSEDDGQTWIDTNEKELILKYKGKYQIKAYDIAGNESLLKIEIDINKTKPKSYEMIWYIIPLILLIAYLTYQNIKHFYTIKEN